MTGERKHTGPTHSQSGTMANGHCHACKGKFDQTEERFGYAGHSICKECLDILGSQARKAALMRRASALEIACAIIGALLSTGLFLTAILPPIGGEYIGSMKATARDTPLIQVADRLHDIVGSRAFEGRTDWTVVPLHVQFDRLFRSIGPLIAVVFGTASVAFLFPQWRAPLRRKLRILSGAYILVVASLFVRAIGGMVFEATSFNVGLYQFMGKSVGVLHIDWVSWLMVLSLLAGGLNLFVWLKLDCLTLLRAALVRGTKVGEPTREGK